MIEIRVIGEDPETIKKEIAFLAAQFGIATGEPAIERKNDDSVVASATEEPPKRKRRTRAEMAAEEALPAEEDPFGDDEPQEETVDLEALKKDVIDRLQKLYSTKGGADTGNSLLSKHGRGEKKFSKLPLDAFPAIAKDLDVLGA